MTAAEGAAAPALTDRGSMPQWFKDQVSDHLAQARRVNEARGIVADCRESLWRRRERGSLTREAAQEVAARAAAALEAAGLDDVSSAMQQLRNFWRGQL